MLLKLSRLMSLSCRSGGKMSTWFMRSEMYPEGEQYIYDINPTRGEQVEKQVRVYRDRMTLLHLSNEDLAERLLLTFTGGNVSHVLISTQAKPKTLFDFNSAPSMQPGKLVMIAADGEPALWCAIFGGTDGWATVGAAKYTEGGSSVAHLTLIFGVGLVVLLLVMGFAFGGPAGLAEALGGGSSTVPPGEQAQPPIWDRVWCWVTRKPPHESTQALTREMSMSGFVSSDVIDRHVEDQFLHRGGMGDDGI